MTLLFPILFLNLIDGFGRQPEGFAVLVGVRSTTAVCRPNEFFDNRATAGAGEDVAKMYAMLIKAGFRPENICKLQSKTETTTQAILSKLEETHKRTQPGDLFVFYFSGHGDTIPDRSKDEDDKHDELMLASNGCLLDDDLHRIWTHCLGVRIVMIVDACHAGTMDQFTDFSPEYSTQTSTVSGKRVALSPARKAMKPDRFICEKEFRRSTRLSATTCLAVRKQPKELYQMIYIGASRDPTTTPGDEFGGVFTQTLFAVQDDLEPDGLVPYTYRQLCELVSTCPSGLSYGEIGPITDSFRKSFFLQIR